jgi:hypothetical protein
LIFRHFLDFIYVWRVVFIYSLLGCLRAILSL